MATSIISNGDFENGTSGWSFTNQGSGVSDETETIDNHYCNITSTESIYQQVGVSAGQSITVSLLSRGIVSGTISLMLINSNTSYWSDIFNSGLSSVWTGETFTFTVDSAWTGPFVIHFQAGYSATSTDSVQVDNITVTQ